MKKSTGHNIAYIRVSSVDQSLDRQKREFEGMDKIFEEKASGKDTNRPKLQECIQYLRAGDTLYVHSIDRLARNIVDLQSIVGMLNEKGVSVHFQKEGLTFTGQDDAISKLRLSMMGAFAEFERSLIKERQLEGIKAAQEKGVKFGRTASLNEAQIMEIRKRIDTGEPKTALAKEYGVSRQTLYSALK